MDYSKPSPAWFYDTLDRLWPLLHSDKFLRDYEFTAGAFLEGRALYVSALGPQPQERKAPRGRGKKEGWPWTAVYYYIQAHTDDEWQIGRLIDRINTLGTLRLASTMEVANLMKAGSSVNALLQQIKAASKLIQGEITKMAPDRTVPGAAVGCRASIQVIDDRMRDIQTSLGDINRLVSPDISYRLERSSYYLRQFEKEALALREERIEGYQKYQEFVARRMSGIFGYFELLRKRMGEIEGALAALGRQYSALKITFVTSGIDELVTSMRQEDSEIRKIQEFGEVALVGILMPYYVGMMVDHIYHLKDRPEGPFWFLVIMSIFVGILIYRRRRTDLKGRFWFGKRGRTRTVSAAFLAYAAFMWIVYVATHPSEFWATVRGLAGG